MRSCTRPEPFGGRQGNTRQRWRFNLVLVDTHRAEGVHQPPFVLAVGSNRTATGKTEPFTISHAKFILLSRRFDGLSKYGA
jgi:hypothetical protein